MIVALALFVAACGDNDGASTSTAVPAPDDATSSTAAAATSAAASSSTSTATPPSTSSNVEGELNIGALDDLLALYEITPLRITYTFGEGDERTDVVLAQDPTADPSVKSITILAVDTKIIISEDATILCDGMSSLCFELPNAASDSLTSSFLGPAIDAVLTAAASGTFEGIEITQEAVIVAGREGVCFTITPPAGFSADIDLVRQCIDNELGFLLLLEARNTITGDVSVVMELINFAQPTAEDFDPTGPVTTTP